MKIFPLLITLVFGFLAGFGLARLIETPKLPIVPEIRIKPSDPLPPSISRFENELATNGLTKADFYEQWVQALYASKLSKGASVLFQLRRGKTNEAIAALERNLDLDLKKVQTYLLSMEKSPADSTLLSSIRFANEYRVEFPYRDPVSDPKEPGLKPSGSLKNTGSP